MSARSDSVCVPKNCSWMMIKSFLIIRFSNTKKRRRWTPFQGSIVYIVYLSHFSLSLTQLSAKLHNACGHDIERHVTCFYKELGSDWTRRHTGNKITNYLRPYLCSVERRHKNLCCSVSLFMMVYFLCVFAEKFYGKISF